VVHFDNMNMSAWINATGLMIISIKSWNTYILYSPYAFSFY
jgi:hypothetical protein